MWPAWLYAASAISGAAVGFVLGVIGGGGSILAIPLLLYFAGLATLTDLNTAVHLAVGSTALAVGANALANFLMHWRRGNVSPRGAAVFSAAGVPAAWAGAWLGKATRGEVLLAALGAAMVALSIWVLKRRAAGGRQLNLAKAGAGGAAVGFLSGFLGIGGGFLVAPALMWAGLDVKRAVGTSLAAVAAFGLTTAAEYATSGYLDPLISLAYLAGGVAGGAAGVAVAAKTPREKIAIAYAAVLAAVGIYTIIKALKP
ncbi:sulfite exporter TauE/SafE family protein [Pyrobaculum neutrophilum]|uniref:Probable membrane transporter protein n=1 Tax=Pyrobaculum neutrophilum (strain DSM 2338 / JCM 9278 / NBRC 100436 / V24Sta) TaxID=444157 RepID=B1YCE0_PYRNV|nr:sulfite exporter TauE/SafE family protein [Pyrobaculum neutrophilum]ACB39453.1 protein of unknown function DUF81 [Pyrobaculum neutrophilum V24Sta]